MYKIVNFGAMATVVAPDNILENLKKALTIKTKDFNEKEKTLALYKESKDGLEIPIGLVNYEKVPQDFFSQNWERVNFKTNIVLRPKQEILVNKFMKNIKIGGILCAKTGTGKSVMGIEIAKRLGLKTLIIVPLTSLVSQWKENIVKFTDVKENEIGIIQGGRCDVKGKKVCIAMLHTLAKEKYPELESEFGTVIFDEVHKLGAETFSVVARMFNCRYRVGLSATPRRKDGTENVFFLNIGNIISSDNSLDLKPEVIVINHTNVSCSGAYNRWDNKFNLGKYFTKISISEQRNKIILNIINKLYKSGRNILVLCDRIPHVKNLYTQLKKDGVDVGMWIGEKKEKNKKVLVATHGSCGIGVDIPELDTLIFASPRADVEQPVGRIMRIKEGKKTPLIIDIVDTACKEMRGWFKSRERFYKNLNANIRHKYIG